MTVYLDGKTLPEAENQLKTIDSFLKEQNRVVNSLIVNEAELINTSLEEVLANSDGTQVIKIETIPAAELTIEALKLSLDYIPRLVEGLANLRDLVLDGNIDQTHGNVEQALEGLEWVMTSSRAASAQAKEMQLLEKTNTAIEEKLSVFKELEIALREEDYTLVCDLFEYEIVPFLEKILAINEALLAEQHNV